MDFRFLHSGDIHLDSPLRGLSGQAGRIAQRIREAPRRALENLIGHAIEEQADFLLIAGDLYDGSWRDYSTGLFFSEQMGRLNQAGIPVFLIYGNHDAESQITRRLQLPGNVHLFSADAPQTHHLNDLRVALHGQSFKTRDVTANLAAGYPDRIDGWFNIGLLHTGLAGTEGHAAYAPCSLEELKAKGYDYWALGHVHEAAILSEHPPIVFCGNLQGRHIRETGAKGAFLVEVRDGVVAGLEKVDFDEVRWQRLSIDVSGASSEGEVLQAVQTAIEDAAAGAQGRLLACRVTLEGATELHSRLVIARDHLLEETRSLALGMGEDVAWVEKLVIATRAPGRSMQDDEAAAIPGDLLEMLASLEKAADFLALIGDELAEFNRRIPADLRDDLEEGPLQLGLAGDHERLVRLAREFLLARMTGGEG